MQIPFADALLSRLSRREAGLELLEEIEDEAAESVDVADLSLADPALLLQRMENFPSVTSWETLPISIVRRVGRK